MRRILRGWVALVLLGVCLVAMPYAVHAASTPSVVWSQTLGSTTVYGDEIAAHGQGAVTAANCSTAKSAYRAATFDKSKGVMLGSIVRNAPQDFCGDTRAAGPDGALYGIGDGLVAAYRQGSRLWQRQPTVACGDSEHVLGAYRMTLGGNTLWLLASGGSGCANGNYLVGLRVSDGRQVVVTSLGVASAQWAATYAQGVAVIQGNGLRYFDTNGTQTAVITLPAGTAQNPNQIAITAEGRVIAVQQTGGCATAIRAYQPAGAQWSYTPEGQCDWIPQLRATPSGGVAFDVSSSSAETVALDAHGHELWRNPIPDSIVQGRTFADGRTGHWLRTDTLGNVIVLRQYSRNSGKHQGYYIGVLNSTTGRPAAEFYTDTHITSELSLTTSGNMAVASDRIYLAFTKCRANPCLNSDPQELYALEMAVGAEYPQVADSSLSSTPEPTVNPSPAGPNACPALQFIGVRGSGETANDAGGLGHTVHAVKTALTPFIKRMGVLALDYPAVPVLAGGLFKYPTSYRASVAKGQENLRKALISFSSKCPSTPIVLAGYSQGAHVAGDMFQALPGLQRQIVAVVLIGDPRFNPRQTEVNNGTYSLRLSGAAQLIKVKPRKISTDLVKRVRSYCHQGDPVCNFTPANLARCADRRRCPHAQYISGRVTDMAGTWIAMLAKSQLHLS